MVDWLKRFIWFEENNKNCLEYEEKVCSKKMAELIDVMMNLQRFSWPDYLVLVLMLFLCILIGIYFGFNQKSNSENEYLMGGRTMSIFPVAMSLVARYFSSNTYINCCFNAIFSILSFISGITLLGLPTEIYSFGIQYLYVIGGVIAMGIVMGYVFLPVFHDLNITSTYEVRIQSKFKILRFPSNKFSSFK